MVNPFPPAGRGPTVSDEGEDPPGRGTWWGLGVIVIAIVLAVAFGVATHGPDDVARAVVAAQARGSQSGAPPVNPSGAPAVMAAGVAFPNLMDRLGWRAVGRRDDTVSDRAVTTLMYERDGRRIAYSVVSGSPLGAPPGSRVIVGRAPVVFGFDADGRTATMFNRGGHSVVISGLGVSPSALVRAARSSSRDGAPG